MGNQDLRLVLVVHNKNLAVCVVFTIHEFAASDDLVVLLPIFTVHEANSIVRIILTIYDKYFRGHCDTTFPSCFFYTI